MRDIFNSQLNEIRSELSSMSRICLIQVEDALKYFESPDYSETEDILSTEMQIKEYRRRIELKSNYVLLMQQPVASDFRLLSNALKAVNDLERIGTQCADMCELLKTLKNTCVYRIQSLQSLKNETLNMVRTGILAFTEENSELAEGVIKCDDIVDSLYCKVKDEIIERIRSDPENGGDYLNIFMSAKYLERIADHAENLVKRMK